MKIPKKNSDLPRFEDLPFDQQLRIRKWIREFEQVETPITKALKRVAEAMECSYQTATRNYYAWKDSEDWGVLINYAKLPYHDKARRRFYSWWQKLCLKSKTIRDAYIEFVRLFKSGKAIPGMPPTQSRDELPSGFDYNSLIRHTPKKWSIWRSKPNGEQTSVIGCDKREETIANLRRIIFSGDAITDIKFKGQVISAKTTLALLADADLKIVKADSNS
jgi:hypothetical protein